ncbi:MAG: GIN domain-containing protein [Gammaproteobacteria bacterium]
MRKSNKTLLVVIGGALLTIVALAVSYRYIATNTANYSTSVKLEKWESIVIGNNLLAKKINLPAFSAISADGNFDIEVTQADKSNILVDTDKDTLSQIKVAVTGADLSLLESLPVYVMFPTVVSTKITTTALDNINLSGQTMLHADNIRTENMTINMTGNSTAYLKAKVKTVHVNLLSNSELHLDVGNSRALDLKVSGNGEVYLSGVTKNLAIETLGNAAIDAGKLAADDVTIKAAGSSDVVVQANRKLTVESAGDCAIRYIGNPEVTKNVVGESTVVKVGTDYSSAN